MLVLTLVPERNSRGAQCSLGALQYRTAVLESLVRMQWYACPGGIPFGALLGSGTESGAGRIRQY